METAIDFILYEKLKKQEEKMLEVDQLHIVHFIYIVAVCKLVVSSPVRYPYEVVRTRLQAVYERQQKYQSFFQSLFKVWLEEGRRGLYIPVFHRIVDKKGL